MDELTIQDILSFSLQEAYDYFKMLKEETDEGPEEDEDDEEWQQRKKEFTKIERQVTKETGYDIPFRALLLKTPNDRMGQYLIQYGGYEYIIPEDDYHEDIERRKRILHRAILKLMKEPPRAVI